jgi:hypothetical protein
MMESPQEEAHYVFMYEKKYKIEVLSVLGKQSPYTQQGAAILGNKLFWKVNYLDSPAPQQKVQESHMMSSVANADFKDSASDFMYIRYNLCSRLNQ